MGLLGETVRLTHYGRKSGVTIWFVKIDGATWIGSLSADRAWVENGQSNGKAAIDFGEGPGSMRATWVDDPNDVGRYKEAIAEKYPIASRIPRFLL